MIAALASALAEVTSAGTAVAPTSTVLSVAMFLALDIGYSPILGLLMQRHVQCESYSLHGL